MLTHLALLTLVLASNPQTTKHKKKSPAAKPLAVAPTIKPTTAAKSDVLRTADCVLVLKGQIVRQISMTLPQGGNSRRAPSLGSPRVKKTTASTAASKIIHQQTLEKFEYELPGILEEVVDPKGTVIRFRFTPTPGPKAGTVQARLHLEDQSKGPGFPATVVEATEVTGGDPFVFEAAARGQQIVPVSGMVFLNGRIQNPAPTGSPITMVAPVRPVVSLPLPPLPLKQGEVSGPSLQFQGISLWAWANSKVPFTVASTIVYNLPGPQGSITGSVDVAFRVGATR